MPRVLTRAMAVVVALACAPAPPPPTPAVPEPNIDPGRVERPSVVVPPLEEPVERVVAPEVAQIRGWLPRASLGADRFLRSHPAFDGRGVLIGILDTGIDASVPGLGTTSTGSPKILDLRDFSDEGAVPLAAVTPNGDSVVVAGRRLTGLGRVAGFSASGRYYAGVIAEIPLGAPPAADLNGNGVVADTLPIVVTRATDGWVLFADTDGNGSLAGERPVHDYLAARETFGWSARGRTPGLAVAANFAEDGGEPRLALVFDSYGHGTHVAGVAAAHDLYGIAGFDGVAPGAQLLGLKISNTGQGGVSKTGSIVRAMDYAIRFATARRLALVLNLSFGVGTEVEGGARIDRLIDSVLAEHPDVVMTVSAGNDGPGISTVGFPGSAPRPIGVGATLPAVFLPGTPSGPPQERVAYFSARGNDVAKPDLVAPGAAYSAVPRWKAGDELAQGTSTAAPHVAGLAALLASALRAEGRTIEARTVKQALMVTAQPTPGASYLDEGTGLPDAERAYAWLISGHGKAGPEITVRELARPADSLRIFEVVRAGDSGAVAYRLRADAPWIRPPTSITIAGRTARVPVGIVRRGMVSGEVYNGTVTGWTEDTLAGPVFRLPLTVIVPLPRADSAAVTAARLGPGGLQRVFVPTDSARPFEVSVRTMPGEAGLAFLYEPGGRPAPDPTLPAGPAGSAATFSIDAAAVVPGLYEVVAVAPSGGSAAPTVSIIRAPFSIRAAARSDRVTVTLGNATDRANATTVSLRIIGAERVATVEAHGGADRRLGFVVPAWARAARVELAMDPAQWGRFTDFGVVLHDSAGRRMAGAPLNYATGRLELDLPARHGDLPVTLGLYPGLAQPDSEEDWSLDVAFRVYGDTAAGRPGGSRDSIAVNLSARGRGSASFPVEPTPWPLGAGFHPLALVTARAGGRLWTRETGLAPTAATVAR